MGYQALLFCPDEKLARVVSQVFSELAFSIELVQEPFGAVKKLMAQRYDAIVVDCENETNAALLFKSARNSSSNQSSLAIAVVEGQAGVAKAYRIGANLVLTKPINVEQAKGTLRVARGLLRKTSDPVVASPPTAAPSAPLASPVSLAAPPVRAAPRSLEPPPVSANKSALPEFETPLPAVAASAMVEELQAKAPVIAELPAESSRTAPEPSRHQAPVSQKAIESPAASFPSGQAAAAAPAPAREAAPERRTVDFEAAYHKDDAPAYDSTNAADGPSFAALDDNNDGSGNRKKILLAAAAVVALATFGYLGWSKLSGPKTTAPSPAMSEPQPPPQKATPPSAAPMSAPAVAPSAGATNRASAETQTGTSKISLASATAPLASSSPVLRIVLNAEPETKKPGDAPFVVKSAPGKPSPLLTDEAPAPLPGALAVAASSDGGLSNLTAPSTQSQPSLVKVNISQGVSQGLLIKRVTPQYPQSAVAMRIQGAVQLEATIDKEGNIANLSVLKGDAVLARAAKDAVRQWRYKPYYLDGVPVDIQTQITVNFKLPH